jgi:hypothetical protein
MSRPLVFVAAYWTLRMVSCVLDSLNYSCLVCLIFFGKLLHTLIGSFAVWGQPLRIAGLHCVLRAYLLCIGVKLNQLCLTITTLIRFAAHGVFASFWKIPSCLMHIPPVPRDCFED